VVIWPRLFQLLFEKKVQDDRAGKKGWRAFICTGTTNNKEEERPKSERQLLGSEISDAPP